MQNCCHGCKEKLFKANFNHPVRKPRLGMSWVFSESESLLFYCHSRLEVVGRLTRRNVLVCLVLALIAGLWLVWQSYNWIQGSSRLLSFGLFFIVKFVLGCLTCFGFCVWSFGINVGPFSRLR